MFKKVVVFFILMLILVVSLCACNQTEDKNWKEKDINGYYKGGIKSPYFHHFYSLELNDNDINDRSKTFIIRFTEDGDLNSEHEFYVGYGYYSIDKVYDENDCIEYKLKLDYINKDVNANFDDYITIFVKSDLVYSLVDGNRVVLQE